jgi:hypothetical protein
MTDWNIILENNIPQKEGETHYNLAHDFVLMVRIDLSDKSSVC